MKILIELTYYRPHTSGLTIYAERLGKALAAQGHSVTILTSQFNKNLPLEEIDTGVRIVRVPVLFRISKGVIMPRLGSIANRLIKEHDVIHLHLPQLDAAGLALRGRLYKKPTVITYHCDLRMPKGFLSWAANQGVHIMNHIAGLFTHRIVAYTDDYARHSNFLKRFMRKIVVINPPVILPSISDDRKKEFRLKYDPEQTAPIIGMAARFATEKGVEVLLGALEELLDVLPNIMVWFAGPFKNILGEEKYFERLIPRINEHVRNENWKFLGLLSPEQMAAFYPNLDVLVIPSLNSTEAFGLVQIEAMMNGIPSIASNLPGVRQPVIRHQMGEIIPIGDSKALAKAILEVHTNRDAYRDKHEDIAKEYAPKTIADAYINLFKKIENELIRGNAD